MSSGDQLNERLQFMDLDGKRRESIRKIKSIVDKELPIALDLFYETIKKTTETRKFFNSTGHMAAAKSAQVSHWASISSATFDGEYLANVRKVGDTHARIGLEPRWYIGGYAIVVEHLIKAIVKESWPKSFGMGWSKNSADEVGECLGALIKAMMLDMDLSISMYVEAAERTRLKLEKEAHDEAERTRQTQMQREAERQAQEEVIARERNSVLTAMNNAIGKLAQKDLTSRISESLPEAYRALQLGFNSAVEQIESALQQVVASSESMVSGTTEIASAADDLSRRSEQQAASLEQTAAALEEITTTVKKAAEDAAHAKSTVASAKTAAEESREVVRQAVDAMAEIEKSSKEISQIIGVIDEIAFQTNLLALNAGVEAARAGDAGRGFAVVASEVRALAQRSAEAAKQIKALISSSSDQVSHGVNFVAQSGKTLEQIIGHVININDMVLSIAHAAEEQATGLAQVNTAINELDHATQQNAAMVEETTAACHTLTGETSELSRLVNGFTLNQIAIAALRSTARSMAEKVEPKGVSGRGRAVRAAGGRTAQLAVVHDSKPSDDPGWKEF